MHPKEEKRDFIDECEFSVRVAGECVAGAEDELNLSFELQLWIWNRTYILNLNFESKFGT